MSHLFQHNTTHNKDTGTDPLSASDLNAQAFHGIYQSGVPTYNGTTITLPTTSGAITYYYQGTKYTSASSITLAYAAASLTANTIYYVYFSDATGTIQTPSTTFWNLKTTIPICMLYKNTAGTTTIVLDERHNYDRNIDWHIWAHKTIGTRINPADFGSLTLGANATPASMTWSINGGTLVDEDLNVTIASATQASPGARLWQPTSSSAANFIDQTYPYFWNGGTSKVRYVNASYALTDLTSAQYAIVWVYASADTTRPFWFFCNATSTTYTNATQARAEAAPNLAQLGMSPELKLIARFFVKGDGSVITYDATQDDYRNATVLPAGGTSSTPTAAAISYTATAPSTKTNVQSELDELASALVGTTSQIAVGGGASTFPTWSATAPTGLTLPKPTINATTNGLGTTSVTASSGTTTLSFASTDVQLITYSTQSTATSTLAVSNVTVGQVFYIDITNSNSGTTTLTLFSGITWRSATPTLAITTGKHSTYGFICTASNTYIGFLLADVV